MFKKSLCIMLSLILALGLFLSNTNISVQAIIPGEDTVTSEDKIYVDASMGDDYVENQVLVVLSNAASLSLKEYDYLDFAEVACTSLTNLTDTATRLVEAEVEGKDISGQFSVVDNAIAFEDCFDIDE